MRGRICVFDKHMPIERQAKVEIGKEGMGKGLHISRFRKPQELWQAGIFTRET